MRHQARFSNLSPRWSKGPVLVTNKHVAQGAAELVFVMNAQKGGVLLRGEHVGCAVAGGLRSVLGLGHPDPDIDLCMIPVASVSKGADRRGVRFYSTLYGPDLVAGDGEDEALYLIEQVFMAGFSERALGRG